MNLMVKKTNSKKHGGLLHTDIIYCLKLSSCSQLMSHCVKQQNRPLYNNTGVDMGVSTTCMCASCLTCGIQQYAYGCTERVIYLFFVLYAFLICSLDIIFDAKLCIINILFINMNVLEVFMARRAIPMIAFHGVESIYIYLYSTVHLREYALYT